MSEQPDVVNDFVVVKMAYTLKVDNKVVDSSRGDEAIEFIQGQGNIVSGLEKSLYGMSIHDKKKVVVPAEEAYGNFDEEAFITVPRSEFPADFEMIPDNPLEIQTEEGDIFEARIDSFTDEEVRLNLNHILAGKELHFNVEILGLRFATADELAHGHVHGDGHHHDVEDGYHD